ncbi:MAG TPA: pyruvate kinase [Rhodocyclaceae bacterium]|nr:pyruvate kinase [Rhodocyclaceae bacterium]
MSASVLRSTKILATLGPASNTEGTIRALHEAGADVFRLNFSHGSHDDHRRTLEAIRRVEAAVGHPIGVLLDLQGPKLRVGTFAEGSVRLAKGDRFIFDRNPAPGDTKRVCLPHPEIFAVVAPGHLLLVDDGKMRFKVLSANADSIEAEALTDGTVSNRKGVNVPSAALDLSALSDKDKADLAFGLELGVDWVALSFVQRAKDLHEARALIGNKALLMAKIEKPNALDEIDDILAAADGIMVARGDLGVELPPEEVPAIQKRLVRLCRHAGKPVVIATQMLESMIGASSPTRAEASDVATAVYDGADAVMLSAESASGSYPVEAVTMMDRIVRQTERDPLQRQLMEAVGTHAQANATDAIGAAIQKVAEVLPLTATVTYTSSGSTALRIAHQRPRTPILSLTPSQAVARRMTLVWGVRSRCSDDVSGTEDLVDSATRSATAEKLVQPGQPFVVVAGIPFGTPGSTNLLRVVWP